MRKVLFIMAFLSALLVSCRTTKIESVAVPEIEYPDFPVDITDTAVSVSLSGDMVSIDYTAEDKQVEIPLWFWLRLVEYSIDVDSAVKQYQAVIDSLNK